MNNYRINNKKGALFNKVFDRFLIKILICLIMFLIFLIGLKKDNNFDNYVYDNIFSKSISFSKYNGWFKRHFGNIFPINNFDNELVFNDSFVYSDLCEYLDGVKFTVEDNYLVPSLNSGIVVYIGEKDGYGKTIIIEDENGVDIWYSNIIIGNIDMYDYIKKGDYLGETINNELVVVFQKNGEIEDYKKYI